MIEFTKENYKKITLDDMIEYIETTAPQDKDWFKSVALVNNKYSHLKAVKEFAKKYFPSIVPVASVKKPNKSEKLKNW
jgi:hypothetical protein